MKLQKPSFNLGVRLKAAAAHLGISALVIGAAAALVFGVWYPGDYRLVAGGQGLFLILISVDLVMGPLLTFAIFDLTKGWPHLRRDLSIIGLLQLAALGYGLSVVVGTRPVALVFDEDRFRVVQVQDVYEPERSAASEAYRRLPLTGPWLLGARRVREDEKLAVSQLMSQGYEPSQRPSFWQPYAQLRADALARSRPIEFLAERYRRVRPSIDAEIDAILADRKLSRAETRFMPLVAASPDWLVLLNKSGDVVGFAPINGFV